MSKIRAKSSGTTITTEILLQLLAANKRKPDLKTKRMKKEECLQTME